jgi:hypothetical protein
VSGGFKLLTCNALYHIFFIMSLAIMQVMLYEKENIISTKFDNTSSKSSHFQTIKGANKWVCMVGHLPEINGVGERCEWIFHIGHYILN